MTGVDVGSYLRLQNTGFHFSFANLFGTRTPGIYGIQK